MNIIKPNSITLNNFKNLHSLGIKAFTILELVIVMLISSILVVFLLMSYGFVNERIETGRRSNELIQNFILFDMRFRDDISRADYIYLFDNMLILSSSIEPIRYRFTNNCIIRHSIGSDTLWFELPKYALKCITSHGTDSVLVEQINVDFFTFNRDFSMWYCKYYDSKVLFNQGINATLDYEWIRF